MKLELKESNSPFWVLGLDHGKITVGSSTNKPCYYKSSKKWYEFAKQIINQPGIDEVYLITGVEWDNMKGSWSGKEAGSYVQNKGKLILSKNEITSYEDKYGPIEINEGDFPKGMSKDPLPKKGVKTYTSSATTLEGDKKMKLELKENNEDIYIFKPNIESEDLNATGEFWDDIDLVKKENGKECKIIKSTKIPGFAPDFEEMMHDIEFEDGTIMNNIFGEYLIVKDESKKVEEALDPKLIVQGIMLAIDNWDELVKAVTKLKELSQPVYDKAITILQYLKDKGTDIKSAASEIANIVTTSESFDIKDDEEILDEGATKLEKGEGSTFENAGTTWKVLTQNEDDTLIVALDSEGNERNKFVVAWGLQPDGSWNQGHYFQNKEDAIKYYEKRAKKTESLKESKIVEPIGNPQTAGSFVNIDIDLDHMEVSDFIIRLTQAIRSEQNAILEYTALRSANGITNEERANIDSIIEEEKNHMAAITTMLYKQILSNHTENVDKANDEFILPKFGADLFDEKSNLKESIETLLTKVEGSAIRMSDEFYVGDDESGRMYHGLGLALDAVKNIITKSGDQCVIQNATLADDSNLTESVNKSSKEDAKVDFDKLLEPFNGQDIKYLNEKRRGYQGEFIASIKYNDSYKSFVDDIRNNWEKIYNYDSDESYAKYTNYGSKQIDFEMNANETIDRITVYVEYEIPTVESVKLKEEYFSSVDEFINELKTDTNYDEIAYHINQYRKLDKEQAMELMDLLFEIEDTKNPKECVQDIINSITKTEDTKITEQNDKFNIEIDVEYDSDVANQIFDNIARVIGDFNKNSDVKLTNLNLKDGKFYFTTNKEVDEKFVEDTCKKIFDEATNYEYQINIK